MSPQQAAAEAATRIFDDAIAADIIRWEITRPEFCAAAEAVILVAITKVIPAPSQGLGR